MESHESSNDALGGESFNPKSYITFHDDGSVSVALEFFPFREQSEANIWCMAYLVSDLINYLASETAVSPMLLKAKFLAATAAREIQLVDKRTQTGFNRSAERGSVDTATPPDFTVDPGR